MKTAMKRSVKPAMNQKTAMTTATEPAMMPQINPDSKWLLIDTKWVKEMMLEIGPDGWVQVWKRF